MNDGNKAGRAAPSLAGRALLAIVLMVGFYLLALGICVALGVLCWMDATEAGRVHPKLWLFAAFTVGIVLWSVFPRRVRFPDPGVPLRREQAPRLFALVEDVARRAGQEMPKKVFLVPEINAFVAQRNSWLGMGGERILGVGLPLLQVLTVPQFQAVVAHEFGHFHGGDTRLGPFLYKVHAAMGRTIVNLRDTESYLHKPFEWYGLLFLRVTKAISRAQEFAADALSARLVGPAAAQGALRRVGEVGPLFDHYLNSEYFPLLNRNLRPPMVEGFERYLGSEEIQKAQVEIGQEAMQARGNPYDTHPPLAERVAAIDALGGAAESADAGAAAVTLLDGVPALEERLLVTLTGGDKVLKVPAGSWRDCGAAYGDEWRKLAAELAPSLEPTTVGELLTLAPQVEQIAATFNPKIPAAERRDAGAWCLGFLLGAALMRAGFRIETGPGDPIRAVRGDAALVPMQIGRAVAAEQLTAEAWAETCAQHGIGELRLTGPEQAPAS